MTDLPFHSLSPFLDLLALATILGILSCRVFVLPAHLLREGASGAAWSNLKRLLVIAMTLLTVTSVLVLATRTAEMSGQALLNVVSALPTVLFKTHYGMVWFIRAGALVLLWLGLCGLLWIGHTAFAALMLMVAGVIAWTYSASGHAADLGDYTATQMIDWLHVLAASVWGGSLLATAIAVRPVFNRDPQAARRVIATTAYRLSQMAGIALAGVIATGICNAVRQINTISDLWNTAYGRILIVKLLLVFAMVALGAINRYLNLPYLRQWGGERTAEARGQRRWRSTGLRAPRPGPELTRRFWRKVAVEAVLVVAVIGCVAVLIHTMPPMVMPPGMHHPGT